MRRANYFNLRFHQFFSNRIFHLFQVDINKESKENSLPLFKIYKFKDQSTRESYSVSLLEFKERSYKLHNFVTILQVQEPKY